MAKPLELTTWAIDEDALKTATDSQRWNFGWTTPANDPTGKGEKPNLNQQNYWQNAVHKWIEYLKVSKTPLGTIIAVASNLSGAFDSPTGVVTDGFIFCDGTAIPDGYPVTGNAPQLTDDRFLMGSSVAGSTGGNNSITPSGGISGTQSISHTHAIASHDHGMVHNHQVGWWDTSLKTLYFSDTATQNSTTIGLGNPFIVYSGKNGDSSGNDVARVTGNTLYDKNVYSTGAINAASGSGSTAKTAGKSLTTGSNTSGTSVDFSNASFSGDSFDNRPKYLTVKYFLKVDI